MDFEQFSNEAMKQEEEQRTIKCALVLEDDVRFFSLTPSQYNLLMYLSDEKISFYKSLVNRLDEGTFEFLKKMRDNLKES